MNNNSFIPENLQNLALQAFGTSKAAEFWFLLPCKDLGGNTPVDLIKGGNAMAIELFLCGLVEGNYG
jgi:uncharacterized protein (DUF2384 family)